MADPKKPAGTRRIIDVTHGDKAAPSDNSKSVIVSNRPILKDPMVVPEEAAEPSAGDVAKTSAAAKPTAKEDEIKVQTAPVPKPEAVVAPPTAPEPAIDEPKPKAEAPAAKPDTPEPAAAKPEPQADPAADKTPEETAETAEAEAAPATDKAAPTPAENTQQQQLEAEAEAKRQAAIDKLADSKKYYLPIDTVEKKRSRRFVALGVVLSLLLIVAWADIALDAGLIQLNGVKPVTHFFSN